MATDTPDAMDIEQLAAVVKKTEMEADAHRSRARHALKTLKADARAAATPWRIVSVGAISGFLAGRGGGAPAAGPGIGGRLFGSIAQALITALGAGATAGAAATTAADAAVAATTDAAASLDPGNPRLDPRALGAALGARAAAPRTAPVTARPATAEPALERVTAAADANLAPAEPISPPEPALFADASQHHD